MRDKMKKNLFLFWFFEIFPYLCNRICNIFQNTHHGNNIFDGHFLSCVRLWHSDVLHVCPLPEALEKGDQARPEE
jgi:hypothetical protein